MEKEEEVVIDNNVKEGKVEKDEESQWTKTKIERKKEKRKSRQLEEQKKKNIQRNKRNNRNPLWNYRCINCKIMGLIQGCANCGDWEGRGCPQEPGYYG